MCPAASPAALHFTNFTEVTEVTEPAWPQRHHCIALTTLTVWWHFWYVGLCAGGDECNPACLHHHQRLPSNNACIGCHLVTDAIVVVWLAFCTIPSLIALLCEDGRL